MKKGKNKIFFQATISLLIFFIWIIVGEIDNQNVAKYYAFGKEQVMKQLTLDDLKKTGYKVLSVVKEVPAQGVSLVTKANSDTEYGEPIDKKSTTVMTQVHAVAGGKVIASGLDDKIGMYIKIKHENAVSTYGNLSNIKVVESERVQRGEIIGSYDNTSDENFYYHLKEEI